MVEPKSPFPGPLANPPGPPPGPPPGVPEAFLPRKSNAPKWFAIIALGMLGASAVITVLGMDRENSDPFIVLLTVTCLSALVFGILAIVMNHRAASRVLPLAGGIVSTVLSILGWVFGALLITLTHVTHWVSSGGGGGGGGFGFGGGAWGRPLRIRGKQLHPSLTRGADWTAGPQPDPTGLDDDTRRALEALWLHDAQKEHASVPAFSRVSWLLASAGGPAELLTWSHRAAIEEIEHTRACFALAAGYGGRSFTVEPMPELLLGGLDGKVDPRITLAIESLSDGCQLEDFNADVAAACARVCEEPVTRGVLEMIAREERSHADLSWAVLVWLVEHHRAVVASPLVAAAAELARYPRPTAVSADKRALVDRASEPALRRHGRLPDARWAAIWDERLIETRRRLAELLGQPVAAAA